MKRVGFWIVLTSLGISAGISAYAQQAVVYEGARLITGDGSAPIENGAFVVENGHITAVGPQASVKAPAGSAHVSLAGKTVMPGMVNAHVHIGYEGYSTWGARTTRRRTCSITCSARRFTAPLPPSRWEPARSTRHYSSRRTRERANSRRRRSFFSSPAMRRPTAARTKYCVLRTNSCT